MLMFVSVFAVSCANSQQNEDTDKPLTIITAPNDTTDSYDTPESRDSDTTTPDTEVDEIDEIYDYAVELCADMTLKEKLGQLFLLRAESTESAMLTTIDNYHVGGIVLFASDFAKRTPETAKAMIDRYQEYSKIPMLVAVDEEGGTVVRVSKYSQYRETPFKSPRDLIADGGLDLVKSDAAERCELLLSLGINLNLAPVADISENRKDFIYYRSAGGVDAACDYVRTFVEACEGSGVGTVLKHFPGYGGNADTHTGIAIDERAYDKFVETDFKPFIAGIEAGT
ncbi:MAG: beta-hexosaminidase, partial [Clostridiales bacterium]|nr:beta-hexosaminidase [Clostridiales bacterium]